jgi:hypothetical protein
MLIFGRSWILFPMSGTCTDSALVPVRQSLYSPFGPYRDYPFVSQKNCH